MIPIMMIAGVIDTSIKDKLNPTARPAMLIATDKTNNTSKLEELTNCFDSLNLDSYRKTIENL